MPAPPGGDPEEDLRYHEAQGGDFTEVTVDRGRVSMKPKKVVDADETLTAAEARKVRVGLKQLKEGKTHPWSQVKRDLGMRSD